MVKILHISDIHFGKGFINKSTYVRNRLIENINKSFKKAIQYSIENKMDILIVSGDLFDSNTLDYKLEKFLLNQIEELKRSNIKFAYSTGNHDPQKDNYILSKFRKYDNVIVFDSDEIKEVDLVSGDMSEYKLIGCGNILNLEDRDLIENYPKNTGDKIHIGIAHSTVYSAMKTGNEGRYMPTSSINIKNLNYDYFALGHIHIRQKVLDKAFYSGSLTGLTPLETGPKGGLEVNIDKYGTEIKAVNFSLIERKILKLNFEMNFKDEYDFKNLIEKEIDEKVNLTEKEILLRIEIKGKSNNGNFIENIDFLEMLSADLERKYSFIEVSIKNLGVTKLFSKADFLEGNEYMQEMLETLNGIEEDDELIEELMQLNGLKDIKDISKYIKDNQQYLEDKLISEFIN